MYTQVATEQDCCRYNDAKIRGFKRRATPEQCHDECSKRGDCEFFSHSKRYYGGLCILCEACELSGAPGKGRHYTSWRKQVPLARGGAVVAQGLAAPLKVLSALEMANRTDAFAEFEGEEEGGEGAPAPPAAPAKSEVDGLPQLPEGLQIELIAGIGAVFLLLIVLSGVVCYCCRRRGEQKPAPPLPAP